MKKRIMILGLLLSVAITAGCSGKDTVTVPPLMEPVSIQLDKTAAYIGEIYDVTYFDSAVVPFVQELSFATNGTVGKVHFYPGMEVKKGDVLMSFDTTLSDLALERKRLDVEKLKLQLEDAKVRLWQINSMKPMVIPTVDKDETDKNLGTKLQGDYRISGNRSWQITSVS